MRALARVRAAPHLRRVSALNESRADDRETNQVLDAAHAAHELPAVLGGQVVRGGWRRQEATALGQNPRAVDRAQSVRAPVLLLRPLRGKRRLLASDLRSASKA
eukprot:140003-Pleurochrysis_carterae.AAC.3